MSKSKLHVLVSVVISLTVIGVAVVCERAEAKTYTLSFTSVLAEGAAQSKGVIAWAQELEKRTKGEVKIGQMTWNGAILKPTNLLEGLRDRVVDVAFVSNVYWPTKTPLSNALQPVFLDDFSGVAPMELELYNTVPELKEEWLKWKVIPVAWFAGADQVLLSNFKFDKLEDLKAKKIRALGSSMSLAVKRWGGIPVAISSADAYTALEKGTVDMISGFPAYALVSNKMAEVSKQITNFRYGGWCMWFGIAFNAEAYNELPDSAKKIIAEIAPIAAQGEAKANFDDAMAGFKLAKKLGQNIVQLSPEESLKWQKVMDPPSVWEENIKAAEAAGYKNARPLMDKAVKMVKDDSAKNKRKTIMEQYFDLEKAGK